ncbi:hypothetical protein [Embleya sp. NBC_00896]|uniref:hypothetical protein n=1 Tax=Embleya sp. NBC_00896 TaxID=2975961 RepID=UPI002F90D5CC|nr:hypothetical protein OG928_33830 [Embleya sp. NBC_00896]
MDATADVPDDIIPEQLRHPAFLGAVVLSGDARRFEASDLIGCFRLRAPAGLGVPVDTHGELEALSETDLRRGNGPNADDTAGTA